MFGLFNDTFKERNLAPSGRIMNNDLGITWERPWLVFRQACPGICLDILRKGT